MNSRIGEFNYSVHGSSLVNVLYAGGVHGNAAHYLVNTHDLLNRSVGAASNDSVNIDVGTTSYVSGHL